MSYLYTQVSYIIFETMFRDYGRLSQFPLGLRALYNYLEELAYECNGPMEIDVVALCCEFAEENIANALKETGCEDIEDLKSSTLVIEIDETTIIYQAF